LVTTPLAYVLRVRSPTYVASRRFQRHLAKHRTGIA
jgi:hypothetical protein